MPNENDTLPLTGARPASLALLKPAQNPIAEMLSRVISGGVTEANVAAMDKLCDLYLKMQAIDTEKQFASAFVALQADMPSVKMTKAVPNNDGTIRYHFAPYEEIMETIRPLLLKHGFTITFSCDYKDGRIVQTCTLQHVGGHKQSNQFMVRVGSGPPKASEAQADGAASTYAKRFALCNALNIICEIDTDGADARNEGGPITRDQVQVLREMVRDTKSDEAAFLKYAGAPTYEEIGSARYAALFAALQKKAHKP